MFSQFGCTEPLERTGEGLGSIVGSGEDVLVFYVESGIPNVTKYNIKAFVGTSRDPCTL